MSSLCFLKFTKTWRVKSLLILYDMSKNWARRFLRYSSHCRLNFINFDGVPRYPKHAMFRNLLIRVFKLWELAHYNQNIFIKYVQWNEQILTVQKLLFSILLFHQNCMRRKTRYSANIDKSNLKWILSLSNLQGWIFWKDFFIW